MGVTVRRAAAIALLLVASGCGGCDRTAQVPCTFEELPDGSRRMSCPDGTSATFPPPVVAPRTGAVSGTASRFGDPRRDGIDIWLTLAPPEPDVDPEAVHAFTDADGRFRFDGVPPGVHVVSVASPGFHAETRFVVVDPGEFVLEPVTLRRGVESLACEDALLVPSPRHDAFLVRYGDGPYRRLVYWEPGGAGMVPLAERVSVAGDPPYYDADGGLIHVLEHPQDPAAGATLVRYEVDTGRRLAIADGVSSFHLALGGDALVFWAKERLEAWNERFVRPDGSGAVRTLASDSASYYSLGPGGRLVAFTTAGMLVAWDMEQMTGEALGALVDWPRYSPDGSVLVANLGARGDLTAWDAEGPRVVALGKGSANDVSFHDSGRRLLALEPNGVSKRLLHVDLDGSGAPEVLRERVEWGSYGPGDGGLAWAEVGADGEEALFLAAGPGAAPEVLGTGPSIGSPTWTRDGRRLYFVVHDGDPGTGRLDVFERGVGVHSIGAAVIGAPFLEAEGSGVFFLSPRGAGVGLDHWDPATDAVIHVVAAFDPSYVDQLDAFTGPGARVLLADLDGGWWRWDPAAGTVTPVGRFSAFAPTFAFLADGGLAFVGDDRSLALLGPGDATPRIVGSGLPFSGGGLYGGTSDGQRLSYLHAPTADGAGSLVLFDRARGAAIPLDDGVTTAVQGDRFVAYVKNFPVDEDHPQRLYLVTYPVAER